MKKSRLAGVVFLLSGIAGACTPQPDSNAARMPEPTEWRVPPRELCSVFAGSRGRAHGRRKTIVCGMDFAGR